MKRKLLSIIFLSLTLGVNAQDTKNVNSTIIARGTEKDTGWATGGTFNINFSQVSLTNWAGGGQNTIAVNSLMSLFANYKEKRSAWDNSLDLAYGLTSVQSVNDGEPFKSDDRIELNSKYGQQLSDSSKWYYGALLNFRSQFDLGYTSPTDPDSAYISNIMAPGFLTFALGFDYKPNKAFTVFMSPLSSKTTFVMDDRLSAAGAFGVDTNSKVRFELGGLIQAKFQADIMKNVNLKTTGSLFSNYLDEPENIDVFWDVLLTMKVNKFISASVSTTLIYDEDIDIAVDKNKDGVAESVGPRTQFKQAVNVGFTYKF